MTREQYPIVVGKRIYTDENNGDKQPFLNKLFAIITIYFVSSLYHILALLCILAIFYSIPRYILLLLLLSLIHQPTVYYKPFLNSYMMKCWREYFSFSIVFDDQIDRDGTYIMGEFPHGVIPMAQLCAATIWSRYHHKPSYSISVKSALWTPIWRYIIHWVGCVESSRRNIEKLVDQGYSVGILAGGVAEMYKTDENKDVVMAGSRKGYIRIAVEKGISLAPIYYFGNSQLYKFGPKWFEPFARKLQASVGVHYNKFGLPFPKQIPQMCVVGKVIKTKKTSPDDPNYENYVTEIHQRLITNLKSLYDKYSELYGYKNGEHPLIIE